LQEGGPLFPRLFTVEEANELLPELRILFAELAAHRDALREKTPHLEGILQRASGNGGGRTGSEYGIAAYNLYRSVERIRELGVLLKDLDAGIMDFPCARGGEVVLLCWHPGEEKIGYWHDLEAGYRGRRPISEL
jgi:hypothetical protein